MTRVAAIDCGTNSIRLLISDVRPGGSVRDVHRSMEIVRLGQGVDAHGEFQPEAIERTRVALAKYVQQMKFEGVTRVRMVDRKSTRLNSSHVAISYAVFCLKIKRIIIYMNNNRQ